MLIAHTFATWAKSAVKRVVDRTRPESGDDPKVRLGKSDAHEENSFPSGHSAGAMAVAQAFARTYPDWATTARGSALAVSGAQVPRGTHYVGDVVVGLVIGLAAERASDAAVVVTSRLIEKVGEWQSFYAASDHGGGSMSLDTARPRSAP